MTYVRDVITRIEPMARPAAGSRWIEPPPLPAALPRFHEDPLLHAILARRLGSPEESADFLDPRPRPAPDPRLLPGLTEAMERVARALQRGETIGIFGDYDTDGVTSAALLTLALRAASGGAQPFSVRLPRRSEGYGLSVAGVDDLHAAGARLLVAVDCGSKDHHAVEHAARLGMDVVILDHHRITEPPPHQAIVASAQLAEGSPYAGISAAGVAYLLATALAGAGFDTGEGPGNEPTALLDLAMIGIIGDVSPLVGVNRPLVRDGLRQLRATRRPGLRALADEGRFDLRAITSGDVAFKVSPRLNAPGRLADPRLSYELLICTGQVEARRLARQAEEANRERKRQQERVLDEVEAALAADSARLDRRVLIFSGEAWEPGIIGLAAGKLVDRFDRPVIVLSRSGGMAHGSARSVPGFDITEALTSVSDLLRRYGGHARAAGLSLDESRIDELDEALQAAIAASSAEPPGPPRFEIDADAAHEQLTLEVARRLQSLGPFGEGNPAPLLRIQGAPLRDYQVIGKERTHLKIRIGHGVDALFWGNAERSRELVGAREVALLGTLETSLWNNVERVQMIVRDFRVSTA